MIFFYSFCKLKYSFCFCCLVAKLCPTLFVTPWTVACQTPLSMEFFRQEYWSGEPFPSPGDLPDPGTEPGSPALQADSCPRLRAPQNYTTPSIAPIHSFSSLKVKRKVTQLCPTLCDPMAYTVHGILQARILEWVDIPFSRGSSQPKDRTQVSHIAGRFFTS